MDQPDTHEQASFILAKGRRKGMAWLFLLAAILVLGVLLWSLWPKPALPPVVARYTPRQTQTAEQHVAALRDQFLAPAPPPAATRKMPLKAAGSPDSSASSPSARPPSQNAIHLQLSQADLNAYLSTDPRAKAMLAAKGVRAVQIVLRPPHDIVCRAAILYHGHPADVQIAGHLFPNPTTVLRLEATSAQVGRLPLPASAVTAQADKLAAAFTARLHGRLPITVQSVQVIGDRLVLTGKRQQAAAITGT